MTLQEIIAMVVTYSSSCMLVPMHPVFVHRHDLQRSTHVSCSTVSVSSTHSSAVECFVGSVAEQI